jgi:UDP-N-acetylmuramoyl-tripeptide--D-alanyl-D-alanine ligase
VTTWSEAEVAEAVGMGKDSGKGTFTGISSDTRTIRPGALFVAIEGERFDGHNFLAAAATAGATGAIVRKGTAPVPGLRLFSVADTLRALGDLAAAARRKITGPVVAITGSNGKTTTKEMVAAVLRTRYRTHATRANDNNLVGIPLTILAAPADTQALAIEAGANLLGEIPRAREIIQPSVALITNVAPSHLEGFGSIEGVMKEKLALATGVPLAIVGTEPPALAAGARRVAKRVVTAGLEGADQVPDAVILSPEGRPRIRVDGREIALPLLGMHQAANAMLVWALVKELGLDQAAAAAALASVVVPGGRGEIVQQGGLTILNDCYNANPASFRAAIATARTLRGGRRLVFAAGTMRELGAEAPAHHATIARELVELEPDLLAAVGDFVPALAPYAARLGDRLVTAPDAPALGPKLAARLRGDELVVLKASRGVALERIIPLLTRG